MPRVTYQTCSVLRITPWTEHQTILTLLSKENCLFSALWSTVRKPHHLGADLHPNLFQTILATLQHGIEGGHRLRQFEVIELSPSLDEPKAYIQLNLMARLILMLHRETAGDPQVFSLWQKHKAIKKHLHEWCDFLRDVLYTLGTLTDQLRCEQCQRETHLQLHHKGFIYCQHCSTQGAPLHPSITTWFGQQHVRTSRLAPVPEGAKLLESYLRRQLPENCWHDAIVQKCYRKFNLIP